MIWRPKVGQRVEIRYAKGRMRMAMKLHGARGVLRRVAGGKGPLNVEVLLDPADAGICVCVPRGNVMAVNDE